jgi:hypothetical protein
MKRKDYVPQTDTGFLIWSENYVNVLTANADRWGIPADEPVSLNVLNTTFKEKYAIAENPASRTKAAIQAKNDAKKAFIVDIRRVYRSFVRYNASITNEDRDLLQVTIHDSTATPATVPSTAPSGTVNTSVHLRHTVKVVAPSEQRKRGGLPDGVHGFETWRKVGGEMPVHDSDFTYLNFSSTSSLTVDYPLEDAGKNVWYRFRWTNIKNQHGPWSEIVNAIIP